jgi:hypothetical protein
VAFNFKFSAAERQKPPHKSHLLTTIKATFFPHPKLVQIDNINDLILLIRINKFQQNIHKI